MNSFTNVSKLRPVFIIDAPVNHAASGEHLHGIIIIATPEL
jgi:hypothetical protein